MKRTSHTRSGTDPIGVVNRGAFNIRGLNVAFTTSEPSPGRWIAVAAVRAPATSTSERPWCMLVGRGHSEESAVADLRWRAMDSEVLPIWPSPSELNGEANVVGDGDPEHTMGS